ncbi:unnamed protein product [Symbiodinium natans]|uniref:Uncharacterized protein n=1 Tax=Symbiodinium natans TaxID=878477 RepID=A0A812JD43_9DINO|nr:unnamed protein product [Symbiodinium natans]
MDCLGHAEPSLLSGHWSSVSVVVASLLSMMTVCTLVTRAGGLYECWRCTASLAHAIVKQLRWQLQAFCQSDRSSSESSNSMLNQHLKEQHLRHMRAGTLIGSCAAGVVAIAVLLHAHVAGTVLKGQILISKEGFLLVCAFWLLLLVSNALCDRPALHVFLQPAYSIAMGLWCLYVMPWFSHELAWALPLSFVFRMLSLCLVRHRAPVLLWQLCHAGIVSYQNTLAGVVDVISGGVMMAYFQWLSAAGRRNAICKMDVASVEAEHEACRLILASLCDAVVELDSALCIAEDCPKLAYWLLHGRSSLRGVAFKQLLFSESEQQNFQANFNTSLSNESNDRHAHAHASAFHLHMRDGVGTAIQVECFHVKFQTSDMRERHLLALREDVGVMDIAASCLADMQNPLNRTTISTSLEMPEIVPSEKVCEKVLELNALNWQILGVSQAFLDAFSMGKPRGRATDYFTRKSRYHFMDQMIWHCNSLAHSDASTSSFQTFLWLKQKSGPPAQCCCRMVLRAWHDSGSTATRRTSGSLPEEIRCQLRVLFVQPDVDPTSLTASSASSEVTGADTATVSTNKHVL